MKVSSGCHKYILYKNLIIALDKNMFHMFYIYIVIKLQKQPLVQYTCLLMIPSVFIKMTNCNKFLCVTSDKNIWSAEYVI